MMLRKTGICLATACLLGGGAAIAQTSASGSAGTGADTAARSAQSGQSASMQRLQGAADQLRQAIQDMAQQPVGARRTEAIRQAHQALFEAQAALDAADGSGQSTRTMGAAGQQSGSQGERKVSRSGSSQNGEPAAVLVLLPSAQAKGTSLADGCWVRFFDDKGFRGDALTLAGPVNLANTEAGNIWRDWESAIVGPKATVRTYDNENFQQRTAVLQAGQSIPDLHENKLGWFEEVKSARVSCS